MKRVILAVWLLIAAAGASAAALLLQHNATEDLLADCDHLLAVFESGDTDGCRQAAKELSDRLEDDMRWFPFFLSHERMENIFRDAAALPYLVDDNDPADFYAAIAAMRVQLAILMDNEWPTAENIL